ncbi:MAG: alpha/beta hydrolase [Actinomycetaceae bacterium]|nr:alpha/beta hydrolase [Actinomycetaceae bacterium]
MAPVVIALGGLGVYSWNWADVKAQLKGECDVHIYNWPRSCVHNRACKHATAVCTNEYQSAATASSLEAASSAIFERDFLLRTLPCPTGEGGVLPDLAGQDTVLPRLEGRRRVFPDLDLEVGALASFIDRVACDTRVCLVAHSMASFLAERYMLAYPQRVSSVIFLDGSVAEDTCSSTIIMKTVTAAYPLICSSVGKVAWQFFQAMMTRVPLRNLARRKELRLIRAVPSSIVWDTVALWAVYGNLSAQVWRTRQELLRTGQRPLSCFVLVLTAESGKKAGRWYRQQQRMCQELSLVTSAPADSELHTRTSHMVMREKPSIVVRAIERAIKKA